MFEGLNYTRNPEQLAFHAQTAEEFDIPTQYANTVIQGIGMRPEYRSYSCGACRNNTTGRILCDVKRSDGSKVLWCLCACDKKEPTIIVEKDGHQIMQLPQAKQFQTSPSWPPELCALFEEASKSFAAGAYTSATMVCRKLLMSCACHEQSLAGQTVEEGKTFVYYVDYIVNSVLTFPRAKTAIDKIRDIGNEANHHVAIVNPVDAERSMTIIQYMLNAIYALPSA